MIFGDCLGDVMEQRCLAGARRRDNQTTLTHPERRHQIHDPRRVTIRHGLELDPLVRVDRRQFLKWAETLVFRRLVAVNPEYLYQLRAAVAAPCFTVNPHAVAQSKTANDLWRNENILRRLHEVPLRVAQESETFARYLDDSFAKFRLSLSLLAVFNRSLDAFARLSIQRLDPGICADRIDNR